MAETADVEDQNQNPTPRDRVRSASVSLLGEARARRLASRYSDAKVVGRTRMTREGRETRASLEQFRDRHAGQTCVIIGNGPSLNDTPMELIRDEMTFGLNRLYLMFDKIGFRTTYHVVVNKYVVEQCAGDFQELASPLFTTVPNRAYLPPAQDRFFLERVTGPRFSQDLTRGIWEGATVTYVAMQVAYFMGFSKVVLIGVDHNFVSKGEPHKLVESKGGDANHFDPSYFGKGFKWQLPDLETSEIAYALAREQFERAGRSIVDATVGGKLEIFPKVDLAAALAK